MTLVFRCQKISAKFQLDHPQWVRQIEVGVVKTVICDQYLAISQKSE